MPWYAIYPEGCCVELIKIEGQGLVDIIAESEFQTHLKANDSYSNVIKKFDPSYEGDHLHEIAEIYSSYIGEKVDCHVQYLSEAMGEYNG